MLLHQGPRQLIRLPWPKSAVTPSPKITLVFYSSGLGENMSLHKLCLPCEGLCHHLLQQQRSCRAWTSNFENKTLNFPKEEGKWPCPPFLLIGKYMTTCILFILFYDQPSETGHFKLWHNDTWPEGQIHFKAGL